MVDLISKSHPPNFGNLCLNLRLALLKEIAHNKLCFLEAISYSNEGGSMFYVLCSIPAKTSHNIVVYIGFTNLNT